MPNVTNPGIDVVLWEKFADRPETCAEQSIMNDGSGIYTVVNQAPRKIEPPLPYATVAPRYLVATTLFNNVLDALYIESVPGFKLLRVHVQLKRILGDVTIDGYGQSATSNDGATPMHKDDNIFGRSHCIYPRYLANCGHKWRSVSQRRIRPRLSRRKAFHD